MRVLMVTPRFPHPPDRGDTLRSWNMLRALAQDHEVWLASVDRDPPAAESVDAVKQVTQAHAVFVRPARIALGSGLAHAMRGAAFTAGYFRDERLNATVARWQSEVSFDAVFVYSSSIAAALPALDAPRRLLDLGDVDSAKWQSYARRSLPPLRWLYQAEGRRVATLESQLCRTYDTVLVVNERERQKLRRRCGDAAVRVIPTTVDLSEYSTSDASALPRDPIVTFVGSMFYPPNVRGVLWLAQYVWPLIRQRRPDARLLIVGARPTAAVRRLAALPGVAVTGWVDDVRPYLRATRVFISPVDGDIGVQSKLITAMGAGRAAVVTPDAAAGIVHDDPPPFIVAGSPRGFADGVVRLLRDDALARALAARARHVAEAHYGIDAVARRLTALLAGKQVRAVAAAPTDVLALASGAPRPTCIEMEST